MSEEKAFTEHHVESDFVNAIDTEVVGRIGYGSSGLYGYAWSGDDEDDEGDWPFIVTRDGREFEVDIDVRVVELTPERKARREADMRELKARIDAIAPREES